MSRRVVVTGVGLVSPVGMGTQANWDALCAGTSGIGPITRFDAAAFSTRFAGEVKNFDPLQFIEKKELKKMDIFIQFAVAASQFAMDDAQLAIDAGARADRVGVFIGSGIGGFTTIEREHSAYLEGGPRKISPFFIPVVDHQPGRRPGVDPLRRQGPEPGDLHRVHGVGARHRRLLRDHQARRGRCDDRRRRRSGGLPDGRRRVRRAARAVARATTIRPRASRPFDKDRDGFVLGEGAGILDPRGARVREAPRRARSTPRSSATACPATRTT